MTINKIKITFTFVLIVFCFSFSKTFASKQVIIFPDSKSLQPAPLNVYPAISHNVQAKVEDYSSVLVPSDNSLPPNNDGSTNSVQTPSNTKASFGYFEIFGYSFIGLLLLFLAIFKFKTKKNI
ncbi:MAG: hypothetical protein WCF92_01245 [bacterium]